MAANKRRKNPIIKSLLSGIMLVSFLGVVGWAAQSTMLRIVIIGDSTVQTYEAANPLRGWGQELPLFFNKSAVTIINKSIGGRSSRSFIEDGHWASTLAILQKGDFLFIQFGHNDRSTVTERHADTAQYRKYLTQYVNESRAKGAIPVLVSPMNMNAWNGTTLREVFNEGANDYRAAMLRVVNASKVPFIDLEKKTAKIFQSMGQEYLAAFIFNTGEGTHFQEMGALLNARLVAEGVRELATDADVGKLAAELVPQKQVTVVSNKPAAGMITASGSYPEGALLTIKTVPKTGEKFQRWQDASGKSLATDTAYHCTMGTVDVSFTAVYQGGTTPVTRGADGSSHHRYPVPKITCVAGMIVVESAEPILSVRVNNLDGREIISKRFDDRSVKIDGVEAAGVRIVTIKTASGQFTDRLRPIR